MKIRIRPMKANVAYERACRFARTRNPKGNVDYQDDGALRLLGGSDFALDTLRNEGFQVSPVDKGKR